jgi:hypothetical protein
MGLPPKVYFNLSEVAARWECTLADLAGWASVDRFSIVAGIRPVISGAKTISGFIAVSVADVLPLFKHADGRPNSCRLNEVVLLFRTGLRLS